MKDITMLLTPGGGPVIPALLYALKNSRCYRARAILADSNAASGNFFLPGVDRRYKIPPCSDPGYVQSMLRLVERESISHWYSALDEELPVIARNRRFFEDIGCRVLLPPADALENALDKRATCRLLGGKVRSPHTFFLDEDFDEKEVWNLFKGQVIIKVTASRGGRHIYIPEDREEYDFYMRRVRKINVATGMEFLVQRFINGVEYNVTSLHDDQARLIYAVSRRKFETRAVKSNTIAAVIERRDDVINQAIDVVEGLGLTPGFNNVECIVADDDNQPYFIEVNGGRPAAQDMNIISAGINVMDLMIRITHGERPAPILHPADGIASLKIREDIIVKQDEIVHVPEP